MRARPEVPDGMVDAMSPTRAQRAAALDTWANNVDTADLVGIDTDERKAITQYTERHAGFGDVRTDRRSARPRPTIRGTRSFRQVDAACAVLRG